MGCWNRGHLSQQSKEVSIAFFLSFYHRCHSLVLVIEFAVVQMLYQIILSCKVSCKFSLDVLEIIMTHLVLLSDCCLPL